MWLLCACFILLFNRSGPSDLSWISQKYTQNSHVLSKPKARRVHSPMIITQLIAASIVVVLEANDLNYFFDKVVWGYGLLSFALAVIALRNLPGSPELDIDNRKFTYKKPSKLENLTWKQKFFGSYEKYERTGMAEVSSTLRL